MGQVPTFNIEVCDADQSLLKDVMSVVDGFIEDYPNYGIVSQDDESMVIEPSRTTGNMRDRIIVEYLPSSNEYAGNKGEGVVVNYQTEYGENMDSLSPKLAFLGSLHDVLNDEFSGYEVEYYCTMSTL